MHREIALTDRWQAIGALAIQHHITEWNIVPHAGACAPGERARIAADDTVTEEGEAAAGELGAGARVSLRDLVLRSRRADILRRVGTLALRAHMQCLPAALQIP